MRPPRGLRAEHGHSYASLESEATRTRRLLCPGVADSSRIDGLNLFESLDEFAVSLSGHRIPLAYAVCDLPPEVEGQTRFDGRDKRIIVELAEQTYEALESGEPRARHTFAHELGHAFVHTGQIIRLAQLPHEMQQALHREHKSHAIYADTEWQADAFAAAFLMPARGIVTLECCGQPARIQDVMDRFGTSFHSTGYRLNNFYKRRDEILSATQQGA